MFMDIDGSSDIAASSVVDLITNRINEMRILVRPLPHPKICQYEKMDHSIYSAHVVWPVIVDLRVQFELFSMLKE